MKKIQILTTIFLILFLSGKTASSFAAINDWAISDDSVTIDVLVAYTPESENYARSSAFGSIDSLISAAMKRANTVMSNSQTGVNLHLSCKYLMSWKDSELTSPEYLASQRLSPTYIWSPYGGDADSIVKLRRYYRADIAVVLRNSTANGMSGGVSLPLASETDNTFRAISMVYTPQAAGDTYTFVHEIGHLLGCAHDDENNSSHADLYDYSFGYKGVDSQGKRFITVMSYYGNGYSQSDKIPYFSSPDIIYNGVPLGDATHDNVQTIKRSKTMIAGYSENLNGTEDDLIRHRVTVNAGSGVTKLSATTDYDEDLGAYPAANGSNYRVHFRVATGISNPEISINGGAKRKVTANTNGLYTVVLNNITSDVHLVIYAGNVNSIDKVPLDDLLVDVQYYTLQGVKLKQRTEKVPCIVRKIYQSGKTEALVIY